MVDSHLVAMNSFAGTQLSSMSHPFSLCLFPVGHESRMVVKRAVVSSHVLLLLRPVSGIAYVY
jgi:hypothetical protein